MRSLNNRRTHESGNVIFLVMIAVILFGALSFAVSNMMRGSNPEALSTEKAKIEANAILGFARIVRVAIQDMKIQGCEDRDLSFETVILDEAMEERGLEGYAHSPPTRDACKVFGTEGGGVNYAAPSPGWLDSRYETETLYGHWFFPEGICIPDIGTAPEDGCASDGEDNEALIAVLPYVNKSVCLGLQERLEREDGDGGIVIPAEDGNAWASSIALYTGRMSELEVLNQDRLKQGCFEGGAEGSIPPKGSYHFFQVLVAR